MTVHLGDYEHGERVLCCHKLYRNLPIQDSDTTHEESVTCLGLEPGVIQAEIRGGKVNVTLPVGVEFQYPPGITDKASYDAQTFLEGGTEEAMAAAARMDAAPPCTSHPYDTCDGNTQDCVFLIHAPARVPPSYTTRATRTSPMHDFEAPSGITYHHNSDFSSNVIMEGEDRLGKNIEIPFGDIRALYLEYLRRSKISALEQASADFLEEAARREL